MLEFTPLDWYWLADDGRVYASARNVVVDKTDKDFAAAQSSGGVTRWPVDETGAQTTASMQDVVKVYGLAVPGMPRSVAGSALVHVLDKATKVTARDLAYVSGLSAAREDMASIVRIAAVDGRAVSAWFDAALGVTA